METPCPDFKRAMKCLKDNYWYDAATYDKVNKRFKCLTEIELIDIIVEMQFGGKVDTYVIENGVDGDDSMFNLRCFSSFMEDGQGFYIKNWDVMYNTLRMLEGWCTQCPPE